MLDKTDALSRDLDFFPRVDPVFPRYHWAVSLESYARIVYHVRIRFPRDMDDALLATSSACDDGDDIPMSFICFRDGPHTTGAGMRKAIVDGTMFAERMLKNYDAVLHGEKPLCSVFDPWTKTHAFKNGMALVASSSHGAAAAAVDTSSTDGAAAACSATALMDDVSVVPTRQPIMSTPAFIRRIHPFVTPLGGHCTMQVVEERMGEQVTQMEQTMDYMRASGISA